MLALLGFQSLALALLVSHRSRSFDCFDRKRRKPFPMQMNVDDEIVLCRADAHHPPFDPFRFKAGQMARKIVSASQGAILMDVENVRGKTGFTRSHAEILHAVSVWAKICHLQGQVSLVVDHGSEVSAFYLEDEGVAVLFAGPTGKADDLIARDVSVLGQEAPVLVVTADRGLIDRCRRSAAQKTVSIMGPLALLEDLEYILEAVPMPLIGNPIEENTNGDNNLGANKNTNGLESEVSALDHEIKLGAELLEAEALLRSKAGVNNKRRGKLKAKVQSLREKLRKSPSLLDQVVSDVLRQGPQQALSGGVLNPEQQTALLARWERVRKTQMRKELTGDRVILAEQWRRQLLRQQENRKERRMEVNGTVQLPAAIAVKHTMRYNSNEPDITLAVPSRLRLVVVSDTHGYERSLMSADGFDGESGSTLPSGDVLLHLGDFAMDGCHQKASVERFDEWLSEQPHPYKIVVRGNHDPRTWYPLKSGANFIVKPTTLTIGSFIFAIVPHMAGGDVSNRLMPRRCHVICTHVPPKDILDRTYSGSSAGSASLKKGVERMASKNLEPPSLWLCGHIHEGRGAVRHDFGTERNIKKDTNKSETLVINAANANSGMAERLDYGPVVVDISMEEASNRNDKNVRVDVVSMDHQYEFLNKKDERFFEPILQTSETDPKHVLVTEMLLAVDLGLRTGLSLFSNYGHLLAYENLEYETKTDLLRGALVLMRQWEDMFETNDGRSYGITHVAIEGADADLRQVWKDIWSSFTCENNHNKKNLLFVRPEEWRADLLISKERQSGGKAKEAACLIARQIVADSSTLVHYGKFPTDVAESVLLGYHVSRRLGWIHREPAVRRYSNGKVIVAPCLNQEQKSSHTSQKSSEKKTSSAAFS